MASIAWYHRRLVVIPAVLLFFFLALDSALGDSPTMDEQNHLARGLAFLHSGDPRLSVEHPPLINTISALPVLTLPGVRLPFDHPSWNAADGWYAFADQLLWVYNQDAFRMIFLARLPIIFVTLGFALVAYRFAQLIWSRASAVPAFLLLLFDPNILAHGRYTTTDVGGAAFLLLATMFLWRMWTRPAWSWRSVMYVGAALGMAFGSKLSNLVFVPIFFFIAWLPVYQSGSRAAAFRRLIQLAIAGLVSVVVLWVIYGFEVGPIESAVGPLELEGQAFIMPTFWKGIGRILDISGGGRPNYLLGEVSTSGWWYYFPIAFVTKTPLPSILLFLTAIVVLVTRSERRGQALFLLIPALSYLSVSMFSNLNIGYRHLIPMLPFLYLLSSGLSDGARPTRPQDRLIRWAPFAAGFLILLSDILIHPHYVSYFNVLAGGPENGHKILVDSNLDWGQDLKRLREWMNEEEIDEIYLSWFGTADPAYYGIDYKPLPGLPRHFDLWWDVPFDTRQPPPGVYAISVSNLKELPLEQARVFTWFRGKEPIARIGYSIYIYRVPPSSL